MLTRRHDLGFVVGDDTHLPEPDADARQMLGDRADIPILCATGQNLIADDQQRRRHYALFAQFPIPASRFSFASPS